MEFAFNVEGISSDKTEKFIERGFRHFGNEFFIYQSFSYGGITYHVIPMRILLNELRLSKKQNKCLRINNDLYCSIAPTVLTSEYVDLFEAHKQKFKYDAPGNIFDLFSESPATSPCKNLTLSVRYNKTLVAASFFDVLPNSLSSVYAAYDLNFAKRSLGLFTMLKEIAYAQLMKKKFLYHGYASVESSFYDYKKEFSALEYLDWDTFAWTPFDKRFPISLEWDEDSDSSQ